MAIVTEVGMVETFRRAIRERTQCRVTVRRISAPEAH
jgi:hypothetical protein